MSVVSVGQVRTLRPDAVEAIARGLEADRGRIVSVTSALMWRRATRASWTGAASDAAASRYILLTGRLTACATRVGASIHALDRAAPRWRTARELVRRAEQTASRQGASVDDAGRVVLPPRAIDPDPVMAAYLVRCETLMMAEVDQLVRRAVLEARSAGDALARELGVAASAPLDAVRRAGSAPLPPPPPAGTDAATAFASAAWWASLTGAEKRVAIREHPDWVGPRDGIPAADRGSANLALLARAEHAAARRLEHERARRWRLSLKDVERPRERVDDLAALRDVLARQDGVSRTLLLVDGSGVDLKAIVAIGDVDRAEHVTTFVGGMTTTVRGDLRRYDDTFSRMRTQVKAMARSGDVAIVTWMGYEAPSVAGLRTLDGNVANPTIARDNADELAAFVSGVDAARDTPVHQTIWAHSYGAALTGFALTQLNPADDVVVFGSPGEPFSRVEQTGLKPDGFNVIKAPFDGVAYFGPAAHGTPAVAVVGSRWLAAIPPATGKTTNGWKASRGHSEYLLPGSVSERNLIAVAANRPDLVVRATPEERAR